jgi:hypothetical protein
MLLHYRKTFQHSGEEFLPPIDITLSSSGKALGFYCYRSVILGIVIASRVADLDSYSAI